MTTALILTTYNRPVYLKRCLESLSKATPPDWLIIIDDASNDKEVRGLINSFDWCSRTIRIFKEENKGIKDSLFTGFASAFTYADLAINLDPDAIVKPDFIQRLKDLWRLHNGEYIVSGFNCDNKKNPILYANSDHVFRRHCNGINMCMDKRQYESHILPALHKSGNWDYDSTHNQPFAITKPSVVQHIGVESTMGHDNGDVACDFYQLELPTVTLFGVDAHDPEGLKRAAAICTRDVLFGEVKIITDRLFTGREAYSKFCIQDMAKYIETEHVLIIHPDGYIQNPLAWDNEWLQYDYIGASWWYKDGCNVGNGGFSLRSKRLLDILSRTEIDIFHPEDAIICRELRPWLEKEHNIKFAPIEVADRFSIEAYNVPHPDNVYSGQFGFHGKHVQGLPTPMPVTKSKPLVKHLNRR